MKITLARLRSGVSYKGPLHTIMDSFFDMYGRFVEEGGHEFNYYNFSWGGKPFKNLTAIAKADIIIIPTENEFHYHIPYYIHSLDLKRSNEEVAKVYELLGDKKIILLCSDPEDTVALYRDNVFPGFTGPISVIDELDFPGGLHALKYYNIRPVYKKPLYRGIEFCYWGTDRAKAPSGFKDDRMRVLTEIKSNFSSYFIGRFTKFKADMKFSNDFTQLIPLISSAYATLCFGWKNNTRTTSRWHEAVACDCVPFIWQDSYDINNTLVPNEWYRIYTIADLARKLEQLSNEKFAEETREELRGVYNNLPTPDGYYEMFRDKLNGVL